MRTILFSLIKKLATLSYLCGVASLIVGVSIATMQIPVQAASAEETATSDLNTPTASAEETATNVINTPEGSAEGTSTPTSEALACTAPGNWDQTVRLYYKSRTQKDWTFQVEEPEMDVTLQFFYYQDYDRYGCPFDCSTGACQTEEIGEGESPFGSFSVADGQEGASDGIVRQSGRLAQGTYTASFWVTGAGSINIGLKVYKRPIPTETAIPPTDLPPTPTDTQVPPTPTATTTENVLPPVPAATDTPGITEVASTATPTEGMNPPVDVVTATPTQGNPGKPPAAKKTPTPPATLAPPSIPTSASNPPALIPETGADLVSPDSGGALGKWLFFKLGLTLVGIALVLQGISRRNRPR